MMVQTRELPTWAEIEKYALSHLNSARNEMSEARDWLKSDFRPVGSSLPDDTAAARSEVLRIISQVKNLIDQAKNTLGR